MLAQGPAGSSSGSATAVAAGFSPISLGTELEGSITWPASRAGLYAIKLTPGSVDQHGFQPGAPGFDSQGPYAKISTDVAILSAIIQRLSPGHYLPLATTWDKLKLGFVEPNRWRTPGDLIEEIDGFFQQTDSALLAASRVIEERGGKVVRSVNFTWEEIADAMPDLDDMGDLFSKTHYQIEELLLAGNNIHRVLTYLLDYQMKMNWPGFLELWNNTPQTVEDLIRWNEAHADLEFTPRSLDHTKTSSLAVS